MKHWKLTYKIDYEGGSVAHYTHDKKEAYDVYEQFKKEYGDNIRLYEAPMPINDHDEIDWTVIDYFDAEPMQQEPVKDNGGEGFTPGEWEACKNNDGWPDLPIWTTIDIGNGILQNECVATVWANDKAEANARLICQAPAMYVALKAMSQNYSLLLGSIDDANENDYSLLTEAEAILSRIQLNK